MAGMMVPMIRVVSPLILGAYHGRLTCTIGRTTDLLGTTTPARPLTTRLWVAGSGMMPEADSAADREWSGVTAGSARGWCAVRRFRL